MIFSVLYESLFKSGGYIAFTDLAVFIVFRIRGGLPLNHRRVMYVDMMFPITIQFLSNPVFKHVSRQDCVRVGRKIATRSIIFFAEGAKPLKMY